MNFIKIIADKEAVCRRSCTVTLRMQHSDSDVDTGEIYLIAPRYIGIIRTSTWRVDT